MAGKRTKKLRRYLLLFPACPPCLRSRPSVHKIVPLLAVRYSRAIEEQCDQRLILLFPVHQSKIGQLRRFAVVRYRDLFRLQIENRPVVPVANSHIQRDRLRGRLRTRLPRRGRRLTNNRRRTGYGANRGHRRVHTYLHLHHCRQCPNQNGGPPSLTIRERTKSTPRPALIQRQPRWDTNPDGSVNTVLGPAACIY